MTYAYCMVLCCEYRLLILCNLDTDVKCKFLCSCFRQYPVITMLVYFHRIYCTYFIVNFSQVCCVFSKYINVQDFSETGWQSWIVYVLFTICVEIFLLSFICNTVHTFWLFVNVFVTSHTCFDLYKQNFWDLAKTRR